MPTIAQQIDEIIRKRTTERLPKVQDEIDHLTKVEEAIKSLDGLIEDIKSQIKLKSGSYYVMLQSDPTMEARFDCVSTELVKGLIEKQKKELNVLKARFSRPAVQVAFVGYERQGKSKFLQSISGLNDRVIPAFDGNSCTAALSVIRNSRDRGNIHIEFYSQEEFVENVNDKLKKFFPTDGTKRIYSIEELSSIIFPDTIDSTKYALAYGKFKKNIVGHLDDYRNLIGKSPMNLNINQENEKIIVQYVAQYEPFKIKPADFDEHPELYREIKDEEKGTIVQWDRLYYKYLSVKSVTIDCPFTDTRTGDAKLILVDTVGLGDDSNKEAIENEMYRVLKEDCDAAVDLYFPPASGGSFNGLQRTILENIYNHLDGREPNKWLFYVVNKCNKGEKRNINAVPGILKEIELSFKSDAKGSLVADVFDINGASIEDVNQKLMTPILNVITTNLDSIDTNLVKEANKSNELLYQEYKLLADAVAKVVSSSMRQGSNELKKFRELYKNDLTYSNELRILDNKYYQEKDKPCLAVKDNIEAVISKLTTLIDKPDVITIDVAKGIKATNELLEKYCKIFRNRIYAAFRDVNTNVLLPLQNQLKDSLVQILFENARLGRIPLRDYAVEDGPSQLWLSTFIKEKVDKDAYPYMYHMLNFILDYEISIEGLMEYNVARCLDTLDKHSSSFKTMSPLQGMSDAQQAKKIWSEIVSRTSSIQIKMLKWRDDFSLIPSHSFYARISMFRDLIVDDTDTNISEELYNFYSENRMAIWRDQFVSLMKEEEAFGKWNEECIAITDLCKKNSFLIDIKDN